MTVRRPPPKRRKIQRKKQLEADRPPPDKDPDGYRARRIKFVEAYKKHGDISQAAVDARISRGEAKDIIDCNPELREDVISLLNRLGATPERIVREMARIAFVDPRDVVNDDGTVKPLGEWPEDAARAVSGIDVTKRTWQSDASSGEEITSRPKFWDKNAQLRELAKMQQIAGADTQRVGNVRGERLGIDDPGTETRDQIVLSLLALVPPKRDPEPEKGSKK